MARAHTKTVIDAMIVALRAIDGSGADSFTPSIVQRHDEERSVESPPNSIIVSRIGATRGREESGSGWSVSSFIEIECNVYSGAESDVPTDEAIEEAEEDVFRALVSVDWDTIFAEFADFKSETFREQDPEHPAAGFTATVEVQFKVAYDSPGIIIDL